MRKHVLAIAVVVLATSASSLAANAQTGDPTEGSVEIAGFAFGTDIEIGVGGSVTWSNADPVDHTVTAVDGSFHSGSLSSGDTFGQVFTEPGAIDYFCSIHPSMTGTINVTVAASDRPSGPQLDEATVLHRTTVLDTDPLGVGGPALTVLVPDGWLVQGGPVWRHHYSNLATLEARITSTDLYQAVEFFPLFPQIWQRGGIPFFPAGSNYLGNDVRRPIRDAAEFLDTLVLPAYRAEFAPRIIDRRPMQQVAQAYVAASAPGTEAVAERVLTEHFVGGRRILEEFTVVLTFTPNPFIPGAVIWAPQLLYAVRAPDDDFDSAYPVLQAVATSPILELEWYAAYEYVLGLSQRNGLEAIRAAGAASRIIADANAEITDTIVRGYEERQAINDRVHEQMSQTILGIETYTDPWDGATLELPNGFDRVFTSAEGTVILTDSPSFDPIQAFPLETWDTATRKR